MESRIPLSAIGAAAGNRLRELAHRCADGIEVSLLWDAPRDEVRLVVFDGKTHEGFERAVPARSALAAFRHPYTFAPASCRVAS